MRLIAAVASVVITVSLAGQTWARPSVGRAGGGGGHHGQAMARPHAPQARPSMPHARPQMPQARPQMPQARPNMQRPNVQRPNVQRPNFQRPNVGSMQRPNLARPTLPNAGMAATRPAIPARPTGPAQMPRPGIGSIRPAPGIQGGLPGGLPGMNNRPSPGGRPSLGGTTKPAFPRPDFPGAGGNGNRPGGGGLANANRPVTLPGTLGPGGGNRPGIGTTKPAPLPNRPGIGGNRPGIGGDRPGIGGDRPVTLPGDLANRPSRPGGQWNDRPGRPGIGGNRPGIGDGNNIWNSGNWNGNTWINNGHNNNFNNVNVGGWGYPGWNNGWNGGHWCNNWNNGYVNPHYGGWYNSCWSGNWGGNGGGWWAPFALGAATWGLASTVSNWGLGYGWMGYGAGGYVNPYYGSIPATVVASSPYDYSQPVVVNNYVTNDGDLTNSSDAQGGAGGASSATATASNPADQIVDESLAKFRAGDYAAALTGFDKALKISPDDSVIHEVRALTLFALARYPEAAATLNSVLAVAPGMDWTTISNVYGSVDAYTQHLRKLEDFCKSHPGDAAAHFVLAYHYLVGGHAEMAAEALKVVVAKQPGDMVAKRLLEALQPPTSAEAAAPAQAEAAPSPAPAATTAPETDLVGRWKASGGTDAVELTITADSTFTWKSTPQGRPAVELAGTIETSADAIALVSEKAGTMVGRVASKGPDAFEFSLPGAPAGTKPLRFERQK